MFFLCAAFRIGGQLRSQKRSLLSGAIAVTTVVVGSFAARPAHAEDGQAIINKMVASYSKIRSFTGGMNQERTIKTADKKTITMTSSQEVKYQTPNLLYVHITQTTKGPGIPTGTQQQIVSSDGKVVYIYQPEKKVYTKQPARPQLGWPFQSIVSIVNTKPAPTFTVLPESATIDGHAAYVVRVNIVLPANAPEATKKALAENGMPKMYIDKQNYHFLRLLISSQSAGSSASTGGKVLTSISLVDQQVNPTIPASAFLFTPPAGAKLFVPQPVQPGAPGQPVVPAPH